MLTSSDSLTLFFDDILYTAIAGSYQIAYDEQ
jgi:hypothetical protein